MKKSKKGRTGLRFDQSTNEQIWFDIRLQSEEMNFLNDSITTAVEIQEEKAKKDIDKGDYSESKSFVKMRFHSNTASVDSTKEKSKDDWREKPGMGLVSRCNIEDKDNWFYDTILKELTEKMFYKNCYDREINWDSHYKHIIKKESPPEFELNSMWVNFQNKHDHVPLHNHGSLYSFVVFMKIPTHWKEQHVLPKFLEVATIESASDFMFVWSDRNTESVYLRQFSLSSKDEGRMLFYPAHLNHQVYPFYHCDEERITIAGNIIMKTPEEKKVERQSHFTKKSYENNEIMLEDMNNDLKNYEYFVKSFREMVEHEKKESEKEE